VSYVSTKNRKKVDVYITRKKKLFGEKTDCYGFINEERIKMSKNEASGKNR
jgi:hypothetical protein